MSELDELDKKFDVGNMTNLDLCVVWHNHQVPLEVANRAAAELAQLRAALKNAEEIAAIYAANNSALMVALDEVIDLADEGIGYTSQYFREKWNMDGRLSDQKKNFTTPEKEQP